jgi:hypothetical protein
MLRRSYPRPGTAHAVGSSVASIRTFLARVRSSLYRADGARAALLALAALLGLALVTPIVALSLVGARSTALAIAGTAGLVAALVVVAAVVAGLIVPRRRYGSDEQVARWVGQRVAPVASDLLSTVELTGGPARRGAPSADLVAALVDVTARTVASIETSQLVPRTPVRHAAALCAVLIAVHAGVLVVAAPTIAEGWARLTRVPVRPFGGADLSSVPLVGDIVITLDYPAYTKRPTATLPSSSGDFRAMPGTEVAISTAPLDPVASAAMLLERPDGSSETIAMVVDGGRLTAKLRVDAEARYRFEVADRSGRRRVEAAPHVIEIEPDKAPEVELIAPADELDVTNLKRVELAYVIEDDFGIAKAELVWETGKEATRRPLPLAGAAGAEVGSRAQGKFVWDMAEMTLPPGAQVTYHLEVTDNDAVRGPNIGRSKSFRLRVFSPRERHEQTLARQQETAEKMLQTLGGRLTLPEDDGPRDDLHRLTSEVVVELGALVAAYDGDSHADKGLPKALEEMRDRLDKLVTAEAKLVGRGGRKAGKDTPRDAAVPRGQSGRFAASDKAMVAELEDDVLVLADWLDREQMESLLDIQDEIAGHQKRLQELMEQYAKTGDPRLKAEIAREMRALEQRLAEMSAKRSGMAEDVLDQFVNADAMQEQEASGCYAEVRRLFDAGKVAEAQTKLAECAGRLEGAQSAMEGALEQLRGDRFDAEQKKLDELMNDLADLGSDQREVAAEADRIFERYAERADEMMKDLSREAQKKLSSTLERLKERLDAIPDAGLTPFALEELDIVRRRVADLEHMLSDGDLAEALGMARQARQSLDTVSAELEAALEDDPDSRWAEDTAKALDAAERAHPPMKKLLEELEELTPSPDQILSPDDKRQLEKLRRRQQQNQDRARRLVERSRQMGPELPGSAGEEIAQRVGDAQGKMESAEKRMKARDTSAAREDARAAADALDKARQRARDAARQRQSDGGSGLGSEPIRIPGADEYRAPEEFREDILEAMKKRAPEGYDDLVRRYYEELIR